MTPHRVQVLLLNFMRGLSSAYVVFVAHRFCRKSECIRILHFGSSEGRTALLINLADKNNRYALS